ALLRRLSDGDNSVRAVARAVVAGDLDLGGAETDPERMAQIVAALEGSPADRAAILQAIGRNGRLAGRPELMAAIHRLMNRDDDAPSLLPVLRWPAVRDAEVLSIVLHAWPRLAQPDRLQAIGALLARPALADVADPREQVMQVLRRAVTDPSAEVRDRTLRGINALPALWSGKGSTALLLAARAKTVLGTQGIDPASIEADVRLGRPRLLSLATFRRQVNPIFSQAGEDGHACARCHATHTILRIAETDPQGSRDEALMINY